MVGRNERIDTLTEHERTTLHHRRVDDCFGHRGDDVAQPDSLRAVAGGLFLGVAMLFLRLGAEFVGFSQILVYIGAVAILIVFAILLTRTGGEEPKPFFNTQWWIGLAISGAVFGCLVAGVISSKSIGMSSPADKTATVEQIGNELMTTYVLPLQVIGVLLTAAMLGAVIIAWQKGERS